MSDTPLETPTEMIARAQETSAPAVQTPAQKTPPPEQELLTKITELLDKPFPILKQEPTRYPPLTYRNILYALSEEKERKNGDSDVKRLLKTLQAIESDSKILNQPPSPKQHIARSNLRRAKQDLNSLSLLDRLGAAEQQQLSQRMTLLRPDQDALAEETDAGRFSHSWHELAATVEKGLHEARHHYQLAEAHEKARTAIADIMQLIDRVAGVSPPGSTFKGLP